MAATIDVKQLNKDYGDGKAPLRYASWMAFCVPLMLVATFLAWFSIMVLRKIQTWGQKESRSSDQSDKVRKVIKQKKKALGKMSVHDWQVLVLFTILVLLWFFKNPAFIPG